MKKRIGIDKKAHIVTGLKGGVGKSITSKIIAEYFFQKNIPFTLIEVDRDHPDVFRTYGKMVPSKLAVLSESEQLENAANILFEEALEGRILVNLPAQCWAPLTQWLEQNEILDLADENGICFQMLFVTDGGFDSLALLRRSLEYFQGRVEHIVIKNWGRNDFSDWDDILAEDQKLATLTLFNDSRQRKYFVEL